MKKRRFFLVRHGETTDNASGIVQGQSDVLLSAEGDRQALLIAGRLSEQDFDAAYTSDLKRALMTARVILEGRSGQILKADPRLREQRFGIYEGRPVSTILRRMKRESADFSTFVPQGGEDPAEFRLRVADFYEELQSLAAGIEDILIVTHYGVINHLLLTLAYNTTQGLPDHVISNGSVTILETGGGRPVKIETLNDVGHLTNR